LRKIKVLVVDDSAVVRRGLTEILEKDDELAVVGTAPDAMLALKKIKKLKPDVLTLDILMPGMDGLTFLGRLMKSAPMPVVMVSSLTAEGSPEAFRAFELGAIDIVEKPGLGVSDRLDEIAIEVIDKVKAAAQASLKTHHDLFLKSPKRPLEEAPARKAALPQQQSNVIIAIGSSTGGTDAIFTILTQLPADGPGIVIAQHMPAAFTRHFAERLNSHSEMRVREAVSGDAVTMGTVLISPGDRHLLVTRTEEGRYIVRLKRGGLVNRHRPSVDVLFDSVADAAGSRAIGVILTGMGSDGAKGMLKMKREGAMAIAQDEASSVVFGMPKSAIKLGAVDDVLPLSEIPSRLESLSSLFVEQEAPNPGGT